MPMAAPLRAAFAFAFAAAASSSAAAAAGSAASARWRDRPVLGFNPCNGWNCHMSALGEATLRDVADAMASNGMRDAGYTLLGLDDGWVGSARAADGSLLANASAFPSGTLA